MIDVKHMWPSSPRLRGRSVAQLGRCLPRFVKMACGGEDDLGLRDDGDGHGVEPRHRHVPEVVVHVVAERGRSVEQRREAAVSG
eukprot:3279760-Pleurochrysis_carterae.AAC.1